jgi:hypothetical protein
VQLLEKKLRAVVKHILSYPGGAVIALMWCLCSWPVYACQCVGVVGLSEELERSDVIFAGKAVEVESALISGKATFQVSHIWRGALGPIVTTSNVWDCMSVFRVGEEYLVFARKVDGELGLGYQLVASRCGQTRELSYSGKALAVLGPGSPPSNNTNMPSEKLGLLLMGGAVLAILLTAAVVGFVRKRRLRRAG